MIFFYLGYIPSTHYGKGQRANRLWHSSSTDCCANVSHSFFYGTHSWVIVWCGYVLSGKLKMKNKRGRDTK